MVKHHKQESIRQVSRREIAHAINEGTCHIVLLSMTLNGAYQFTLTEHTIAFQQFFVANTGL